MRDALGRAAAAARGMAKIAAWAWIHRCDQLESCRKYRLARSAGDMDPPRFQRFTQHFEHAAIPLGELIEKQHTVVSQ